MYASLTSSTVYAGFVFVVAVPSCFFLSGCAASSAILYARRRSAAAVLLVSFAGWRGRGGFAVRVCGGKSRSAQLQLDVCRNLSARVARELRVCYRGSLGHGRGVQLPGDDDAAASDESESVA